MIESILNTLAQRRRNGSHQLRSQRPPDSIAAQRQRKPGNFLPPFPEIHNAMQPGLVISELPLVNDQPSLMFAFEHLRNNHVEGNHFHFHARSKKLQRQISRSQRARHGNALLLDFALRERTRGNNHRPVAIPHTASASHERVLVLNIRISMKRNRRDVVNPLACLLIQRFNVAECVAESQAWRAYLAGSQSVKHKCVIGVRTMGHRDIAQVGGRSGNFYGLFRSYGH